MGFDKPDLAFVIHYQTPGSVVTYYQQVGRAGRALDTAYGVLLSGSEDTEITDYFIASAFPTEAEARAVLGALETAPDGLSTVEIEAQANIGRQRIANTLRLLSLESPAPVVELDRRWQLTATVLSEAFWERARRLTAIRRAEQTQMQAYVSLGSGHMAFLIEALDGDASAVVAPRTRPLPAHAERQTVADAVAFLRGSSLAVSPRRQWPNRKGIEDRHRAEPGKALCAWRDGGWGALVQEGKYRDNRFADALVDASAALVRCWGAEPAWVTAIPSLRHADLVPDFARRLAEALNLPFAQVLAKQEDRPEQKTMQNSTRQALNVVRSLAVDVDGIRPGPVLLVDDIVDSRWTFTVAAWELRRRGCGAVFPFALADAGRS